MAEASEGPEMILIRNDTLFDPAPCGVVDLFLGAGRILGVGTDITPPAGVDCLTIDGTGLSATPGFIDGHVHIAGAGGDGGPATRTPEVQPDQLALAGTTSCVGCLGTDGITRTVGSLVMKAKSLRAQGLSTWCYTGSYQVPPPVLTGGVSEDLCYIEEIIGVGETAVSDHRSSSPTTVELTKFGKSAHVGGMLAGKAGIVHVHMGDGEDPFEPLYQVARESDLPISKFYPTHVNRNARILEDAKAFGKLAPIDITVGAGPEGKAKAVDQNAWEAAVLLREAGVPIDNLTLSSDACGSLPVYDEAGNFQSMQVAQPRVLLATIQKMLREELMPVEDILSLVTRSPAQILHLHGKGRVQAGRDADILLFDNDWSLDTVIAGGAVWMRDGALVRNVTFGG